MHIKTCTDHVKGSGAYIHFSTTLSQCTPYVHSKRTEPISDTWLWLGHSDRSSPCRLEEQVGRYPIPYLRLEFECHLDKAAGHVDVRKVQ